MATNYGGFADGFSKGFGIVQDSLNNQRYNDLRELDIKERRETQRLAQEEKILARRERAEDIRFRDQQAALAAQDRREDKTFRQGRELAGDSLNATRAETERLRQETLNIAAEETRRDNERDERNAQRGVDATTVLNAFTQAKAGNLDLSDKRVYGEIAKAYENVGGTPLDMAIGGDPSVPFVHSQLTQALQDMAVGADINENSIVDAINQFAGNSAKVGTVLNESATYAPEAYKNGDWKIVGRQFVNVKRIDPGEIDPAEGEQAGQGILLTGDVLVQVQNSAGLTKSYIAPATKGRETSGQQLVVSGDDLLGGYSLNYEYANRVAPIYQQLVDVVSRSKGSPAEVLQMKNDYKLTLQAQVRDQGMEEAESGYGMTYAQLFQNGEVFDRVAEQAVLFGREDKGRQKVQLERMIGDIRATDEYRQAKKAKGGQELTMAETLELNSLFDDEPGSSAIPRENSKAWSEFRNRLGGRSASNRVNDRYRGQGPNTTLFGGLPNSYGVAD